MPRDAETTNAYLHEYWDEAEDVPCPGCGMPWVLTDPARPQSGKTRFHKEDCDYNAWIDENAAGDGTHQRRRDRHSA